MWKNENPSITDLRKNISGQVVGLTEEQVRLSKAVPLLASNTDSVDHIDGSAHVEVDDEKCTACGVCVDACPEGAISINRDPVRAIAAQIDQKLCEACGGCLVSCARDAINWFE